MFGERFPVIIVIIIVTFINIIIIVITVAVGAIVVVVVNIDDAIIAVVFRGRSMNFTISKMEVFIVIATSRYLSFGTISGSISDYSFIIVTIIVITI